MSVTALALAAALGGAALQDQAEPRVETRSEIHVVTTGDGPGRLDADGDGEVTREEFSAPMGDAFDRMDANHDGKLSTEELAAGHGGPDGPGRRIMMMGGPGGPGGHGVQVFTTTRDGGGERDVRVFNMRPDGPMHGPGMPRVMVFGPDGPGGGDGEVFMFRRGGPEGGPPPPGGEGQQVIVRRFGGPNGPGDMDKDGDGKISQSEFLAPMMDAFNRMDADHDGFLDDGEDAAPPPPPPAR